MTIDELLKRTKESLMLFGCEFLLEQLETLELYKATGVFSWFTTKKDKRAIKLENLFLECYKLKLYTELIEYNEINNLEDIFQDTNGNDILISVLKYWKYMALIAEYLDNYGIISESRIFYLACKESVDTSNKLRQSINSLKCNDEVYQMLVKLLSKIHKEQLDYAFEPLFDEAMLEAEILSHFNFEESLESYYSDKLSILAMMPIEYNVLINNIREQVLKNSKYFSEKDLEFLENLIEKYKQNNQNVTKRKLALLSNLTK